MLIAAIWLQIVEPISLSCFMCFKKLFFFLSYEKNKFVENTFKNSTLITTDFLY